MTDRLQKCIDTGGVVALFPLLADWSQEELRALLVDVDEFYREAMARVDVAISSIGGAGSEFLAAARHKEEVNLLAITTEIASVALYYLPEEDAK